MNKLQSELMPLLMKNDGDAIVDFLIRWPDKDDEWRIYVDVRLSAPLLNEQQRQRLRAVRADWETSKQPASKRAEAKSQQDFAKGFQYSDKERSEYL